MFLMTWTQCSCGSAPALGRLAAVTEQKPMAVDAQVMSDACPHRLAPLSEGRIEPTTKCLQPGP